ncbi:shikimate kinase [Auritidibacter sp. NML100628]|uniref:shikimate kinase n=1 Tax=Auritidibacter sp. NML100628 TaxID=2170742 RepID=UPI000D72CCEF|nr:shikimate kinase [Auritidibacter sp. NML100628]PXA77890.1 shikimate kinase [Auritidibacter sp. NML100628]
MSSHTRSQPIALVGPMGSGKSSLAPVLAAELGYDHVDTDELFAHQHGPIPEFFRVHGEPGFRDAEAQVVAEALTGKQQTVISLGGGAVLRDTTRDLLVVHCYVIYLQVSTREALRRLDDGQGRPMLENNPAETWEQIATERDPLYRSVADQVVDTTADSPRQLAGKIARRYRRAEKTHDH